MKIKSLTIFLTCLLLSILTVPAISCCDPPCGMCEECIDGECVWVGCDPPCSGCYNYCNPECVCEYTCRGDLCEECVNNQCKVCGGDTSKVCCDDGSCASPCDEEIDEPRCESEWNESCIACVGMLEFCSHHNTRIFMETVTYTCSGGCDGDCAEENPQPVCSRVYKCTACWFVTHICTDQLDTPVPLDCYFQTDTLWSCSRCVTDFDELVNEHPSPYPSKRCQ